ncbi:hypothetical protein MAR_003231 [Mya arenaria]|uniref:Uncharacterized protein n=1 Tax=Mya arenaria TaxID=6604 RepID=A0ABY7G8Z7_MYAAR|nr:hypothetical protein MAR_003231 [Mya arenaria]
MRGMRLEIAAGLSQLSETRMPACLNYFKECNTFNWIQFTRSDNSFWTRMMWIRPSVVVLMIVLQTCGADRLERMERRLELKLKALQAYVEVIVNANEGDFVTLADRVSKLESIVSTSENDIRETTSNGSRNEHTVAYTKPELNNIQNTLTMYKHSFEKQKREMNDVKIVLKDTLSVFRSNVSLTINSLTNAVSDHVNHGADEISATLNNVSETLVETGSRLRSDIFTYLGNLSFEVKTELAINIEREIDDNNKTLIALNSQVRDYIANETESLAFFKTNILQDMNETRAHVRNETTELEKKVEELIGRANEVVGIIDKQGSTIEDGIMATIKALPGVTGLHGPTVLSHVTAAAKVDTGHVMYFRLLLKDFALEMQQKQRNASFTSFVHY